MLGDTEKPELYGEFLAYSGRMLQVTLQTDSLLAELFPEVDRQSQFREADAWLWSAPPSRRPKNVRRFLRTWFVKAKRAQERQDAKDAAIRREARVGEFR